LGDGDRGYIHDPLLPLPPHNNREIKMSTNIDPVEYGKLISTVETLSKKVESMEHDIKQILALANRSRGAFWVGLSAASFVGACITAMFQTFWST